MATTQPPKKVALLTAGGLAPCLSSAVGGLIERYTEVNPDIEIIAYRSGYKGLLVGDSYKIGPEERKYAHHLHLHGGSPIGNSRVKLTNIKDCVARGLVKEGEDPRKVAADQLVKDGVDILHTIGGDDTNTAAADLAAFLAQNGYGLTVIGLPKTIDNDVIPVAQSLGAWTAAEQGARFFRNIVSEHNSNPRMLIVHEVMGRNCGWLTAATANHYHNMIQGEKVLPSLGLSIENIDVHAVYVPEMEFDMNAEAERLKAIMDRIDNVNIFVSEGACLDSIMAEMRSRGVEIAVDPFGHPRLDSINVGNWFAQQFGKLIKAEKTMVQKSGYFARSAAANDADLALIKQCTDYAVDCALRRESGLIGQDEERGNELRALEFERVKGGKPFNLETPWFNELLTSIGQPKGKKIESSGEH
ncbi:pyrophosphate:fructose 6-phosphate phosphotransferase [Blattamonas nauphoetae]|uniref:Pyrophosphate--fructose 6-phosphate 1-phosphotransferase n=1 Tax=Blattamonas nauphoetae TaxID=2049346 RepID=A0ABQ9YLL8_9EUKA|nr:pyrophosphate:fructose 6-phosphate phosphotransferase [Blattamonas nauphoetae]